MTGEGTDDFIENPFVLRLIFILRENFPSVVQSIDLQDSATEGNFPLEMVSHSYDQILHPSFKGDESGFGKPVQTGFLGKEGKEK